MSLLSFYELIALIDDGVVVGADKSRVNAVSIDVTLDDLIMYESLSYSGVVDLTTDRLVCFNTRKITNDDGYSLDPKEFMLASTREVFNLPNDIALDFKLNSTLARKGLAHTIATLGHPGWHSSKLTLELSNITQYHTLVLKPGMIIGQVLFYRVSPVPDRVSYKAVGKYNHQDKVTESK